MTLCGLLNVCCVGFGVGRVVGLPIISRQVNDRI